ncbi:hypothetical protein Dimus_038854 [Dionaea muscipula]
MDIAESMGMNWMHELYISHSLIQPSGVSTEVRDDVHQFQGISTAHIDPSHEDSEVERVLEESDDDPYEEEVENDELPHPSQNIVNELPRIDDLPDDSGPSHYGQAHTRDGAGFDDVSFYHVRGGDGRVCYEEDQQQHSNDGCRADLVVGMTFNNKAELQHAVRVHHLNNYYNFVVVAESDKRV